MTPAQQLRKVRDVMKVWRQNEYINTILLIEGILSTPEGEAPVVKQSLTTEAAGAGEAEPYAWAFQGIPYEHFDEAVAAWSKDADGTEEVLPLYAAPPAPKASAQALTDAETTPCAKCGHIIWRHQACPVCRHDDALHPVTQK